MYIRNEARGAGEWEATYGSMGQLPTSQLTELPIAMLDPWLGCDGEKQPFAPYSHDELVSLSKSIAENGVIEAICVRLKEDGRFEILAGHNRVAAAKLAGLMKVPAQIRNLDDDTAFDLLTLSNFEHRKEIKPSERARAYKMQLDRVKHQGKTSAQNEQKSSRDAVAAKYNDSPANVQRYIRLNNLTEFYLDLLDAKKLPMNVALELSFLSKEELDLLSTFSLPKKAQAVELREASHDAPLDEERIAEIMEGESQAKEKPMKISAEAIRHYFPDGTTAEKMEAEIIRALEFYRNGGGK